MVGGGKGRVVVISVSKVSLTVKGTDEQSLGACKWPEAFKEAFFFRPAKVCFKEITEARFSIAMWLAKLHS